MRLRLFLLATIFSLAACGGAPAQPGAGGPADEPTAPPTLPGDGGNPPPAGGLQMCQVLTAQDVSAVVGETASIDEDSSDENDCTYHINATADGLPEYAISFRLEEETADLSSAKLAFEGQDVAGVGEAAFWAPSVTVLWFVTRGKTYVFQFVLFGEDHAKALELAKKLAQAALPRL